MKKIINIRREYFSFGNTKTVVIMFLYNRRLENLHYFKNFTLYNQV